MQRWLKNTILIICTVIITIIVVPVIGVYLLAHTGQTAVMLESLKNARAEANRTCVAVIADMKSPDPSTAMAAQAMVFIAIKDKLHPEDQDVKDMLANQVSELEAACKQMPDISWADFVDKLHSLPETKKKGNI